MCAIKHIKNKTKTKKPFFCVWRRISSEIFTLHMVKYILFYSVVNSQLLNLLKSHECNLIHRFLHPHDLLLSLSSLLLILQPIHILLVHYNTVFRYSLVHKIIMYGITVFPINMQHITSLSSLIQGSYIIHLTALLCSVS